MVHHRQRLALALETPQQLARRLRSGGEAQDPRPHQFHRNAAADGLPLDRQPDDAESAFADLADQVVAGGSRQQDRRLPVGPKRRGGEGGLGAVEVNPKNAGRGGVEDVVGILVLAQ